MSDIQYLTCVQTAKLIRAELKRTFPGVKFSVRSDTYSGGASIDVGWVDGPTEAQVSTVTDRYRGADFDGMIDMKSYRQHWLEDDGTVTVAEVHGTAESRGMIPNSFGSRRTAGAVLVHLGADYIFTNRKHSDGFMERRKAAAKECALSGDWVCDVCRHAFKDTGYQVATRRFGSRRDEILCSRECASQRSAHHVAGVQ